MKELSTSHIVIRVTTFLLHALSAVFFLHVSVRCSGAFRSRVYSESVTDSIGYALGMPVSCADPRSRECFFRTPQAYDVPQGGMEWNVFGLLAIFEWLSASFALLYLRDLLSDDTRRNVLFSCIAWNLAGCLALMPYSMPMTFLQAGAGALALLGASVGQVIGVHKQEMESAGNGDGYSSEHTGDKNSRDVCKVWVQRVQFANSYLDIQIPSNPNASLKSKSPVANSSDSFERVILHYTEYCTSASFLYVAVLILFIRDPPSWAVVSGFVGVFLCNLLGVGAHCCKLDQHHREPTDWFDLDWTKCGNHFKLFMAHSWSGLLLAIGIIFYLSPETVADPAIPWWVRFILVNLLVTYSLFGVWATLCYIMAGTRANRDNFDKWIEWLDLGLTVLSAAAKLPVAYTVYYGLVKQPGANVCSLF
jgi:hypothetical protein